MIIIQIILIIIYPTYIQNRMIQSNGKIKVGHFKKTIACQASYTSYVYTFTVIAYWRLF